MIVRGALLLSILFAACGQAADESRHSRAPGASAPSQVSSQEVEPAPVAPPPALLGPSVGPWLTGALNDDFFQWFRWVEQSREPGPSGVTIVRFGHPGGYANDLHLIIEIDPQDRFIAMVLQLRRTLIDGPNAPFARDVSKSFIRAATPALAGAQTEPIALDIEWRPIPGFRTIASSGPPLPAELSEGYLAFLGERPSYRAELAGAVMQIQPVSLDGPWLEISFRGHD